MKKLAREHHIGDGERLGNQVADRIDERDNCGDIGESLTYYREKIDSLALDNHSLKRRVEEISKAIADQHRLQTHAREQESKINQLDKQVSEMQVHLYKEREHLLRLYAENDRLKLRELNDRQKIQYLLQLSGLGPAEVTYFLSETVLSDLMTQPTTTKRMPSVDAIPYTRKETDIPQVSTRPSALIITPLMPAKGTVEYVTSGTIKYGAGFDSAARLDQKVDVYPDRKNVSETVSGIEHRSVVRDLETARGSIKALQRQLYEQTKNFREEIDVLVEDQQKRITETEQLTVNIHQRECELQQQLMRCQDLLCDRTKELIDQRQQFYQAEKAWIAEKDQFLCRLRKQGHLGRTQLIGKLTKSEAVRNTERACLGAEKQTLAKCSNDCGDCNSPTHVQALNSLAEKRECEHTRTIRNLEFQRSQQQNLADMYHEQLLQLEGQLQQFREEESLSKEVLNERTKHLHDQLKLTKQRYAGLERRRQLEIQGYQTDIAGLRKKLEDVENKLLKVTLVAANDVKSQDRNPANMDLCVLKHVRNTSVKSKQMANNLKNLKLLMYDLENEMRRL